VESIEKGVAEVAKHDAGLQFSLGIPLDAYTSLSDDSFVIAISDANFGRYGITAQDLQRAMDREQKVKTALICIGEGAEATW
jgi:von Willebrand factor A domain-containing protein 8